jgi:hypothetical protein
MRRLNKALPHSDRTPRSSNSFRVPDDVTPSEPFVPPTFAQFGSLPKVVPPRFPSEGCPASRTGRPTLPIAAGLDRTGGCSVGLPRRLRPLPWRSTGQSPGSRRTVCGRSPSRFSGSGVEASVVRIRGNRTYYGPGWPTVMHRSPELPSPARSPPPVNDCQR